MNEIKINDIVIAFDEYAHDYVEHKIKINCIEIDEYNNIIAYGDDLTDIDDDEYITRVNKSNFVCIYQVNREV